MGSASSSLKWFLIVVLSIFLGGIVGFLLGQKYPTLLSKTALVNQETTQKSYPTIKTSTLFSDQITSIKGEIIKVDPTLITVKKDNISETFPLSSNLLIFHQRPNQKLASSSSDLKSIELNKEANIVLKVIEGEYKVISISYLNRPQ